MIRSESGHNRAVERKRERGQIRSWLFRLVRGKVSSEKGVFIWIRPRPTQDRKLRLQREIEATDRQIDQLVYELYGLTEEEIKIVEDALRG